MPHLVNAHIFCISDLATAIAALDVDGCEDSIESSTPDLKMSEFYLIK